MSDKSSVPTEGIEPLPTISISEAGHINKQGEILDSYEYKGFKILYIDNPTIGHWEVEGCDEEFDSDLAAARYIDTNLDTLEMIRSP